MSKFNTNAEEIGITGQMFNNAMNERGATTANVEEEDQLLNKAQEELGIKLSHEMPDTAPVAETKPAISEEQRDQKLAEELRKLTT